MKYNGQYGILPPTCLAWLSNDDTNGPDNVNRIRQYIDLLEENGVPHRDDCYSQAKHGFGEGSGSDAEGWISYAVGFWKEQLEKE